MSVKRLITLALSGVLLLLVMVFSGSILENVPADEIVCIQAPLSGELTWYTDPGLKWQGFGKVTNYKKSFQYWFSMNNDQGKKGVDESIATRFNDGGHAKISGSVRVDLPLGKEQLTGLHVRYGSQQAIEHELVRTTFERSIYMSGPLMSSAESYTDKRNQLISFIEDQALHGVYRTTSKLARVKDAITGADKTASVVDIVKDDKAPGGFSRSEPSPLADFSVKAYNLASTRFDMTMLLKNRLLHSRLLSWKFRLLWLSPVKLNNVQSQLNRKVVLLLPKPNGIRSRLKPRR